MKVRDTSPGRLYALSSEIGCTAINGAMAADIPAGGQVVILALDKKIVIDGDDAAKFVEVRWGTNTVVGSRPVPAWLSDVLSGLISIVGDDKFDINYMPAENKLYLQFSLEVTAEEIEEVKSLLERELPKNIVAEMEWINGLPVMDGYMPLEYLEQSVGARAAIDTTFVPTSEHTFICTHQALRSDNHLVFVYSSRDTAKINEILMCAKCSLVRWGNKNPDVNLEVRLNYGLEKITTIHDSHLYVNGELKGVAVDPNEVFKTNYGMRIFTDRHGLNINTPLLENTGLRIFQLKVKKGNELVKNWVPAIDEVGSPCLFDLVDKKPYYNSALDDFTYPGKKEEPTTYSLRRPITYVQLTEHGVRRLYHVPNGYNGTKEEYAADNGFKYLVETEKPEEGYWTPEWRETETQLILDWVETEPPTEEEIQIEDTENA